MPNKPLLRTTMDLVEAATDHDNRDYAIQYPDGRETFCFATMAILNVYPEARPCWRESAMYCERAELPEGTRYATMVELPDGTERVIEPLAEELLGLDWMTAGNLFHSSNSKADQRKLVDQLAQQ